MPCASGRERDRRENSRLVNRHTLSQKSGSSRAVQALAEFDATSSDTPKGARMHQIERDAVGVLRCPARRRRLRAAENTSAGSRSSASAPAARPGRQWSRCDASSGPCRRPVRRLRPATRDYVRRWRWSRSVDDSVADAVVDDGGLRWAVPTAVPAARARPGCSRYHNWGTRPPRGLEAGQRPAQRHIGSGTFMSSRRRELLLLANRVAAERPVPLHAGADLRSTSAFQVGAQRGDRRHAAVAWTTARARRSSGVRPGRRRSSVTVAQVLRGREATAP